MKRGKLAVCVMTILLMTGAGIVGKYDLSNYHFPFTVSISANGQTQEISCYSKWGEYYVLLPSYAEQAEVTIRPHPEYKMRIGDQLLTDGTDCSQFPLGVRLDLYYDSEDNEPDNTVTFLRAKNVDTVYIDVLSGNMDYIHREKGNRESGSIQVYDGNGRLWFSGGLESIRGRGNATWLWEKKPYSLTLGQPADLLGMGEAEEWILLANAPDTSHLRNKAAYDLAAEVGLSYSPECRWVDLYLNGEYAGLYLLTERNEIHPQRVAVGDENFLVSVELEERLQKQNYPYIKTERGTVLRIHQSDLSHSSICKIWESMENAVFAEDGKDPVTGKAWTELIDLESWAKKYLLEEILGNYDAGAVSQYFYYDKDSGRIQAGPVWDMDTSMGGGDYWIGRPNEILAGREHLWTAEDSPLYYALMQKEEFRERVMELFRNVYKPAVNRLCNEKLDEYTMQIAASAQMNQERWPDISAEPNPEEIRNYLTDRISFLETYLENPERYVTVHVWIPGNIWFCWVLIPGETLDTLSNGEEYLWYDFETGIPFDFGKPIFKNTILQERFRTEID